MFFYQGVTTETGWKLRVYEENGGILWDRHMIQWTGLSKINTGNPSFHPEIICKVYSASSTNHWKFNRWSLIITIVDIIGGFLTIGYHTIGCPHLLWVWLINNIVTIVRLTIVTIVWLIGHMKIQYYCYYTIIIGVILSNFTLIQLLLSYSIQILGKYYQYNSTTYYWYLLVILYCDTYYYYAQTPRFAHTLLVLGRSTKVSGNITVPPPLNFTFILHSLKIFNKGGFNSSTPRSLKIFNKGLILPTGWNFYICWISSLMMMMIMIMTIIMMMMMMMMMMMWWWNEPAQVPLLGVLI